MLDDRTRFDLDQALAYVREVLPYYWRQLYLGSTDAGFTPQEAMNLLKTYILAQNPHGIVPPDSGSGVAGGDTDNE